MLLIEGPDMVGKTRLCAELVKQAREQYGEELKSDKFGLPEGPDVHAATMERSAPITVFDRGWPSEIVYGSICRDAPRITPGQARECRDRLRQLGGLIVVVAANLHTYDRLIELHHSRGEAFTAEQCRAVADRYLRMTTSQEPAPGYERILVEASYLVHLDADGEPQYPGNQERLVRNILREYLSRQRRRALALEEQRRGEGAER